jgi:predicted HD phosphohydrolase
MHYKIELAQDHLRAELFDRKAAEETQQFIRALAAKALETGCPRVLIYVRHSRPIFKLQPYGIPAYFRQLAANPAHRVALLSDSDEMRSSQQYIEMLGREQGARVRAFRDEAAAREWLRGESL